MANFYEQTTEKEVFDKRERVPNQSGRIPGIEWQVQQSINLNFGGYIWDPDIAHRQDESFYERIERDSIVAHAMLELRTLVAGSGWTVTVRDEKYEKVVPYIERFLENIEGYQAAKSNLCHALIRGTHAARIVASVKHDYELVPGDDQRTWWTVDALVDRDKRGLKITWEKIDENEPDSQVNRRYYYIVLDPINGSWYKLRRENYVIWAWNVTQSSSLMGNGLSNQLYIPVYTVNQLRDIQLQSYDAFGTGIKIGKIDQTMGETPIDESGDSTHTSPEERAADLATQLSSLSQRGHYIGLSKGLDGQGDEIEIVWAQSQMFAELSKDIQHEERKIQLSLLGNAVTLESGGQGSKARAETQSRMGDRKIQTNRRESDDVWQGQFIQRFWTENERNWRDLGVWTPQCPASVKTNKWVDYYPKEEIENIKILVTEIGLPVGVEAARERFGIPAPKPGEEILKPPPLPGQTAPSVDGSGAQVEQNSVAAATGTIVPKVDKYSDAEYSEQLAIGAQIELEHTNDLKEAIKISAKHLAEDPEYYKKLKGAGLASYAADKGERWITIGGGENSETGEGTGRSVKIDKDGNIIGGAVPKSMQGKSLKEAFKGKEKGKEVDGKSSSEYTPVSSETTPEKTGEGKMSHKELLKKRELAEKKALDATQHLMALADDSPEYDAASAAMHLADKEADDAKLAELEVNENRTPVQDAELETFRAKKEYDKAMKKVGAAREKFGLSSGYDAEKEAEFMKSPERASAYEGFGSIDERLEKANRAEGRAVWNSDAEKKERAESAAWSKEVDRLDENQR